MCQIWSFLSDDICYAGPSILTLGDNEPLLTSVLESWCVEGKNVRQGDVPDVNHGANGKSWPRAGIIVSASDEVIYELCRSETLYLGRRWVSRDEGAVYRGWDDWKKIERLATRHLKTCSYAGRTVVKSM